MTDRVANPWKDAGCKPGLFKPKGVPVDDVDIINRLDDVGWRALWHAYREAMAGNITGLAIVELQVDGTIRKSATVGGGRDACALAGALDKLKTDLLQAVEEK
ncbi:MAG: hypothetical protein ACR2Q4_14705 [Geminicoccaceae bacterium]